MLKARTLALISLLIIVVGCPGEEENEQVESMGLEEGCQPLLAGLDCMLPYPSNFFLVEDSTLESGHRVEMPLYSKIYTDDNFSADVNEYRVSDGFSTLPPIVATFGVPLDKSSFVSILDDYEASVESSSRTLIIDVENQRFVPHFVDVDERNDDPQREAFVLRPMEPLSEMNRYIVVIQQINDATGSPVETPEGFRRIRDKVEDPELDGLQQRYMQEIFSVTESLGLSKSDILLAWDFSTGSDMHVMKDMYTARQLIMGELDSLEPTLEVTGQYESEDDPLLWRTIYGKITVPMVSETAAAGSELHRDENGDVALNGTVEVPFISVVPASLRESYSPGDILLYGHGFLYSRYEVENGSTLTLLNEMNAVGFAIDWWGMSEDDVGYIITTLAGNIQQAAQFGERLPQAMGNWMSLTKAIETTFKEEPLFQRPTDASAVGVVQDPEDESQSNAGALLYDDTQMNFMGISQGHILGGVLAALHPSLDRIILHVGAGGLTHIMLRAQPFSPFLFMLEYTVSDLYEQQKLIASFQMQFDRFDPIRYAPYVLGNRLLFGPEQKNTDRRVLMHAAVADTSVPNFGTYLHARAMELPNLNISARAVYGLEQIPTPLEGSGLVVFDYGIDDSFYLYPGPPEAENNVHNSLRTEPEVIEQIKTFVSEGAITDTCGGDCVIQ